MALIEICNVTKRFGNNHVLKGVSLSVNAAEVIAIIGKSGSGKSTLLRCINGLETPEEGSITVAGREVVSEHKSLRDIRLDVGMIFQQFNLFPHLTVGKNLTLCPRVVKKACHEEVEAHARKLLDRVGLGEKYDAYPDELSGGQQQRVAIARALCMGPKALLCDEITSALDPELVNEVLAVVRSLATEGMTLLLVTHEMKFAREVCDRVVFMHNGNVHEMGPPEQVFLNPQTAELCSFLGRAKVSTAQETAWLA